jgi:hypothetical protein
MLLGCSLGSPRLCLRDHRTVCACSGMVCILDPCDRYNDLARTPAYQSLRTCDNAYNEGTHGTLGVGVAYVGT